LTSGFFHESVPAGFSVIAGVVDTGDKFIAVDKNKDAMEVGSCQG
jgi:hypothetical protein